MHPYREKMSSMTPYYISNSEQFTSETRNTTSTKVVLSHSPQNISFGFYSENMPNPPDIQITQEQIPQNSSSPPLNEASYFSQRSVSVPAIISSPRFNLGPLPSQESVKIGDIPDISHQVSRGQVLPMNPSYSHLSSQGNILPTSVSQPELHHYSAAHHHPLESQTSSSGSIAHAPSPLQNGHHRSFSSTSSMILERCEPGAVLDFNQNLLQQHLGPNSSHLLPRMKTIEMYRKNAKKSGDPAVLFQYAQYMLQTALLLDVSSDSHNYAPATAPATPPKKSHDVARVNLRSSSLSLNYHVPSQDQALRGSLLKEAHHYLKKLADKAYPEAQYFLGDAYSSGVFGKIDNKEAFSLFYAAAKRAHTECAFRTATCYEQGLGTGRDARKGVEFLKMAASKNHPAAMYKLGIYYLYARMGISDTPLNKKVGIKWLERASNVATELTSAAPFELGKLYQTGYSDILIQDDKYALELFVQASALGHVEASAILGHHYELGTIVTADSNLSIHYYTRAALGGDAQSMLAMCAWYMVGAQPYLAKDEQEAFEWAKRAASCGHGKAQYVLANLLDKGIGCEPNATEAQDWYTKAAENGQEKALSRLTDKNSAAAITKKLKKSKIHNGPLVLEKEAQEKECIIM